MSRALLVAVLVLASLIHVAGVAVAQTDLEKALIGKWEGDVQVAREQGRTLIIRSVSQQDGKWIAEGRYGITGKGMGPVKIDVDTSGGRPSLRFTTGANSTVRLNLIGERSLVGTMTLTGAQQQSPDRNLKLDKVE